MQLESAKLGPVHIQGALAALALLLVAFAPPTHGRMLLMPIDGRPVDRTQILALEAAPLKAGPTPGSMVVEGERQRLAGLWAEGVLVLAAPAALCSSA